MNKTSKSISEERKKSRKKKAAKGVGEGIRKRRKTIEISGESNHRASGASNGRTGMAGGIIERKRKA